MTQLLCHSTIKNMTTTFIPPPQWPHARIYFFQEVRLSTHRLISQNRDIPNGEEGLVSLVRKGRDERSQIAKCEWRRAGSP
jgi:hypothetical protein